MTDPKEGCAERHNAEGYPADRARREFIARTAAIGIAGALGVVRGASRTPPDLTVDSGQSASFEFVVTEGFRLVTEYFSAVRRRDLPAIARTLHFPFAMYEGIEPQTWRREQEFLRDPPPSLTSVDAGGEIRPSSYDRLENMHVHLHCPVGAVFSLTFARYDRSDTKLLECDAVLSVTDNAGRWAIQLISAMTHPSGYAGYPFRDAEISERVSLRGNRFSSGCSNESLLREKVRGRGAYDPELPAGATTAQVTFDCDPRADRLLWHTASVGDAHAMRDALPLAGLPRGSEDPAGLARVSAAHPLVIHATHDKAHVLGGYWRHGAEGQLISETREVSIRVWKAGSWRPAGSLGHSSIVSGPSPYPRGISS